MAQVIVVSNRLPIVVKKENGKLSYSPSVGGLAGGLASYVNQPDSIWIGWPGLASDDLTSEDELAIADELSKYNYSPVFLSKKQIDNFYSGYSNSVLWPAFHGLKAQESKAEWWSAYREVNQLFAEVIINLALTNSQVWIHDYQLLLTPDMVRRESTGLNIGFFLHIPFPDLENLGKIKESKKLLSGILGADLVGFHTHGYSDTFLKDVQAYGYEVAGSQVLVNNRTARIGQFPMGIDYDKYAKAGKNARVKAAAKQFKKRYKGLKVIVSVDRLDPTKGLIERLKAYRIFLERNPKYQGKVVLAMVAAPSRGEVEAYKKLAINLDKLVKQINNEFGTKKWQPIDYMNTSKSFEEVSALFQIANIAFIAPLKDGMNLVAKEFVASNRKGGVLILSSTAGAAEELQDALIIDPAVPETAVDALEKAYNMRGKELKARLGRMQKQLSAYTVQDWAKSYVDNLQQPVANTPRITRGLSKKMESRLVKFYKITHRRLIILDYDGSLVPLTEDYKHASPPKSLIHLLSKLASSSSNEILMVSGRSSIDLNEWFGKLPINLIAEHGAALKKAGSKDWEVLEKTSSNWQKAVVDVLDSYTLLAPGSHVEVKPHSVVWHYRATPPYYAQKYAFIIKRILKPIVKKNELEILQGNKVLEIRNPKANKGTAIQPWLQNPYDFILAFGDDATDEALFAALPLDAQTVKVGKGRTKASLRVSSPKDVISLLKKLT